jgi:hypothetical protein
VALVSCCKRPAEEADHNEEIAGEFLRPGQREIQKIAQKYLKKDGCKDDEKEKNDKNIDHAIYDPFKLGKCHALISSVLPNERKEGTSCPFFPPALFYFAA